MGIHRRLSDVDTALAHARRLPPPTRDLRLCDKRRPERARDELGAPVRPLRPSEAPPRRSAALRAPGDGPAAPL
jgi:hypothetical protein